MGKQIYDIQYMVSLAKSKDGQCLSTVYKGVDSHLLWQCQYGHQWSATPYTVNKMGTWCPTCAGKNRTIEDMQELAVANGGKCLSSEYKGYKTKLLWQCVKGHEWQAIPASIYKLHTWCPYCANNRMLSMDEAYGIAKKRGGKCLSNVYKGVDATYKWECSLGHIFNNRFSKIKKGQWCPTCSKSGISEEVARTTFEQMTGETFPKIRPAWLKNKRGYQMEFDGYSNKLGIAFEYHGIQHFEMNNMFMKNSELLAQRIEDDESKQELAAENGVKLFVLTYKDNFNSFPELILQQAETMDVPLSVFNKTEDINIDLAYIRFDRLNELKSIAETKNGLLLSKKWLGVGHFYAFHCNVCSHEWNVKGSEVLAGAWCDKCARRKAAENRRISIDDIAKFAQENDGTLLSTKYDGAAGKYTFRCKNEHVFEAKLNNLKFRRQWCPVCENRQIRKSKDTKDS